MRILNFSKEEEEEEGILEKEKVKGKLLMVGLKFKFCFDFFNEFLFYGKILGIC